MDTVTKPAPRSTDRLLEALSTLAALLDRTINEVKTLDSDFQSRLLQAVHDTESSLQQQAAEHLQRALEEEVQKARLLVTEEMKTAYERELTAAVEAVRQELNAERDKLSAALERATQATIEWEAERSRLQGALHDAEGKL